MKAIKVLEKVNTGLLLLIVTYGLFWLFVGAYYSHPNAEDFSLTAAPKNEGIINAASHLLVTYDGRYFTNILHGINPMALGWLGGYKWTIAFNILFFIFSVFYFVQSVNGRKYKWKTLLFSAFFVVIHFALTPSIVHELYWMVSSFVYLYCWCFTLLWTGSFIRFNTSQKDFYKKLYFTLTAVFLVCSIGINEMMLVVNVVILIVAAYFIFSKSNEKRLPFIFLSIIALMSYTLFLFSPGIKSRYFSFENLQEQTSLRDLLFKTTSDYGEVILNVLTSGGIAIIAFIVSICCFKKCLSNRLNGFEISFREKVLFLAILLIVSYLMIYAFYLPMGDEDIKPYRIYTMVWLLLQLLLFIIIPSFFKLSFSTPFKKNVSLFFMLSFLVGSFWFSQNNLSRLKEEYTNNFLQYFDEEMKMRYSILNNPLNFNGCYALAEIHELKHKPVSIFHQPDIKANRAEPYWNRAYEAYFCLSEVRFKSDSVKKIDLIKGVIIE